MPTDPDKVLVEKLDGFLKIYLETGEDNMVGSLDEWARLLKLARRGLEPQARIVALEAMLRRGVELTPDKRLAWWKDAKALLGEKICANCISFFRVYADMAIGGCHKQSGKPHSCTMSDECSIDAFEPRKKDET